MKKNKKKNKPSAKRSKYWDLLAPLHLTAKEEAGFDTFPLHIVELAVCAWNTYGRTGRPWSYMMKVCENSEGKTEARVKASIDKMLIRKKQKDEKRENWREKFEKDHSYVHLIDLNIEQFKELFMRMYQEVSKDSLRVEDTELENVTKQ